MSAGSAAAARLADQRAGGGATPTPALQTLQVRSVPARIAKALVVRHHYLHSLPGGTKLTLGVFQEERLGGVISLGSGPSNAHRLLRDATADDCLTLTRLWLADALPANSESRVLGATLRALRKHTQIAFLLSYADPTQGHLGTIYQATNWLYTGLSEAMPLYDLGDGVPRHSRSVSHAYGSHSLKHFARNGVDVRTVPQARKHRYVYLLDAAWRSRLTAPVLPYPKREAADAAL